MATKTISAMTAAGTLTGAEVVPVLQSSANVRTTASAIAALANSGVAVFGFMDDFGIRAFVVNEAATGGAEGIGYSTDITRNGTDSQPALDGTGSNLKARFRQRETSAASVNNCSGIRAPNGSGLFLRTSVATQGGGFDFLFVGGLPTVRADQAIFIGYDATQAFTSFDTDVYSTKANIIAFAADEADTNLQIFHNDGSGDATKVDLGFAKTTIADKLLRFRIFTDGTDIGYSLYDCETDTTLASGTISSANIPAANTALMWKAVVGTGASTGTAVTIEFLRVVEVQPDRKSQIDV